MLVLSRHRDESIMIGDDVVVTIVDIRGDKVRLGIEAPQSIPVHRQEVYDAIQRENRRATQTGPARRRMFVRRKTIERCWKAARIGRARQLGTLCDPGSDGQDPFIWGPFFTPHPALAPRTLLLRTLLPRTLSS